MSESAVHIHLVEKLTVWIDENYLGREGAAILIDHPDSLPCNKPPRINGYIPDVCVLNSPRHGLIIGEAKTAYDIERPHSYEQIKAFLKYCADQQKAVFIFAAPWFVSRFAKAFLSRIQKETGSQGVSIVVLDKL